MSVVSQKGSRREKVCMLQKKHCGRASDKREGILTGTGSGVEAGSMWLRLDRYKPARFCQLYEDTAFMESHERMGPLTRIHGWVPASETWQQETRLNVEE